MKINTVIFDIGGVMVGLGRIRFFEQFGFAPGVSEKVMNSTVKSVHWKELDRGILTDEEVIERFVKDAPELEKEIRLCMENVHGIVYRLDTSIPWIQSLKERGIKVLYLSNYSMKVARDNEDAMDFLAHMDGGLLSCDYQVIKPDPAFYQILIDKYDLEPSRCVFLDDLEANLEGARQFGIHTIQVKDHEQAKAELERMLHEA
jgi:putative hydrolase of the HAD superfamily